MLRVRRLGSVPYREAHDLQRALAKASDDYLLFLQHPPVFTMGPRTDPAHLLVDPVTVGAEAVTTDRGGDVTYHGPGQLVVYPIRTVGDDPGAGREHVLDLEQIVIEALVEVGAARRSIGRLEGCPGVWWEPTGPRPRKVAAIGVRTVREPFPAPRRRTLHGVAVNVDCDLERFADIVPCGIRDKGVTSLAAEVVPCTMEELADAVVRQAIARWRPDGVDEQSVVERRSAATPGRGPVPGPGPSPSPAPAPAERAPVRRLRRAGVDPGAGLPLRSAKPPWLRVRAEMGGRYLALGRTIRELGLVTVCEEAGCPNIYECWADGTATFMVNGSRCTRACGFCQVDTRRPLPLDPEEPNRVAEAVRRMGLQHAVVTCVARDDLPDGGAAAIAETVRAIRRRSPGTAVEVLVSDCKGDADALGCIVDIRPEVFNHNVETVARLQHAVRPSAGYARSLAVLARASDAGLTTKSGLMVGLGEHREEVEATLADLAAVGVSIATVGQYLRPSEAHLPVARWWRPEEFEQLAEAGRALGLAHVEATPLTRSSYHARRAAAAAEAPGA